MSIDNFERRDPLQDLLSDDDEFTTANYQPMSRRERRERERALSQDSEQQDELPVTEEENSGQPLPHHAPNDQEETEQVSGTVADDDLFRLLDDDDDDENTAPHAREEFRDDFDGSRELDSVHSDQEAPRYTNVPDQPDDLEDDHGTEFLALATLGTSERIEAPQQAPLSVEDFDAWIGADEDSNDSSAPHTDALPRFEDIPERYDSSFEDQQERNEPRIVPPAEEPVEETRAIPVAAAVITDEDERTPSVFPAAAQRHNKAKPEPVHEVEPDDLDIEEPNDTQERDADVVEDRDYDGDEDHGDDREPIDLVPEKRKLKAGWFAAKQEKEDSREERDAVSRLNELKEKIGIALATEQDLSFRISDLKEELDSRETLQQVRHNIEVEERRLQELRDEVERTSVSV